MRSEVDLALQIHLEETGHEVQFKEEWVFDNAVRYPHLPREAQTRIVVRGGTRFQHAHVIIEMPDGRRYIQFLAPRVPRGTSDERLQHWLWTVSIGKPKLLSQACENLV